MIRHSLILFTALSLGFAPAPVFRPKPETKPDHWKMLLGRWEGGPLNKGYTVDISDGRMIYNGTIIYTLTPQPCGEAGHLRHQGDRGSDRGFHVHRDLQTGRRHPDALLQRGESKQAHRLRERHQRSLQAQEVTRK